MRALLDTCVLAELRKPDWLPRVKAAMAVVLAAVGLLSTAGGPSAQSAQADDGWIGKRVVPKYAGFKLKIENQVVEPKTIESYRVEQVNGAWLWLKAEGKGLSGWAPTDQVVSIDESIAFFTEYIRSNPGDAHGYTMRARIWLTEKHELEIALGDINEPIRLDPTNASVYINRGVVWFERTDYDKASADYEEAIRIDPKYARAHYGRSVVLFLTGRDGLEGAAKTVLNLEGWRGSLSQYAALLGHFCARRAGRNDEAKKLLDEAADKCDTAAWPYPVVKYLRGEIDESKLLAASTDNDKMTEARCYLGLDMDQKGRKEEALAHFRWVKDHGNATFTEYTVALAELDRLTR